MAESVPPYSTDPEERAKMKVDKLLLDLMEDDKISVEMAMRISQKSPNQAWYELLNYTKLLEIVEDMRTRNLITVERVNVLLNQNTQKSLLETEMLKWVCERTNDLLERGLLNKETANRIVAMHPARGRRYVQAVLFVDEALINLTARGQVSEGEAARYREMDSTLADTRLAVLLSKAEEAARAADAMEAESIKMNLKDGV